MTTTAMAFDPRLPGCFDERSLTFADHPFDRQWAFEWLTVLRREAVSWEAVSSQIREYLTLKGAGKKHIAQQLQRAAYLLEPWL